VTDLAPLSSLIRLEHLYLSRDLDMAPLANLPRLKVN
jgi:hypothetical protein